MSASPSFLLTFDHHEVLEDGPPPLPAPSFRRANRSLPRLGADRSSALPLPCAPLLWSLLRCACAHSVVAVLALVLGAALLLVGSGYPRLSSFLTAWLSFGVLLYFLQAVEGVGQTLSLCLAFLLPPPLLAAPLALLPLPVSSSLWGAYVAFVCWLGFHSLYPDALSSSPAGLYLLLALPSAAFAIVAAAFSRVALVVCAPVVGVFLLYQGLTTFIHQPWPLLFALDQQPTCRTPPTATSASRWRCSPRRPASPGSSRGRR